MRVLNIVKKTCFVERYSLVIIDFEIHRKLRSLREKKLP